MSQAVSYLPNPPTYLLHPGNALAVAGNMPFRGLDRFGVSFLNRFEGSVCPSEVLKNINVVDTPGVLAGNKQTVARGYDFTNVCGWFAERADLILLLFDAHKLDISDEFKVHSTTHPPTQLFHLLPSSSNQNTFSSTHPPTHLPSTGGD